MILELPWQKWHGPKILSLHLPDRWRVGVFSPPDLPSLSDGELRQAIRNPAGSAPLTALCRGKRTAAIAIDDLCRPTEAARILPILLDELATGGIPSERVSVLVAVGAHRILSRQELVMKIGPVLMRRLSVRNHSPFGNLVRLGKSSRGTEVTVNRHFVRSDLRIGIGSVVPHAMCGFSGGGKIVFPGLAGIETIHSSHAWRSETEDRAMLDVLRNGHRDEVEEMAAMAGLSFVVDTIPNVRGGTAAAFAGAARAVLERAAARARELLATPWDGEPVDVLILNLFPLDSDFSQVAKAFNLFHQCPSDLVRPGGQIVVIAACAEGRGFHHLGETGMPLWSRIGSHPKIGRALAGRRLIVFSPHLVQADIDDHFPHGTELFNSPTKLVKALFGIAPQRARAGVFPCAPVQILS